MTDITPDQRIHWSAQNDPTTWTPQGRKIWVGHPAIARAIVRFFKWLTR